ncbi:MAG: outer membrane beta-barrel protein [Saprospiraceae bacterium]|nr:outer membrane beta-barrel protein [Saprospiraceae bacterium]
MLRYLFLLLCLCYMGEGLAQAGFSWGISLYPNYSDRRLIAYSFITQDEINRLDSLEGGRFSYSGGVLAEWRTEKVSFQTGVNFMNTGYRTISETILPGDPDENLGTERRFLFRNFNIEIPAELHFYQEVSPGNEFIFTLGGAMSYNISNSAFKILQRDGSSERIDVTDNEQEFRPVNFAFVTAVGWETDISETLSLVIQPTFEFWMRGIFIDTLELNRNLYNLGVKLNLKFRTVYEDY